MENTDIQTTDTTSGATFSTQKESKSNVLARWTSQTRAYLAEYAVLLIVLGSLVFLVNSLFASIINSFSDPKYTWYWTGEWAYKASIGALATVIALIPVLILLTKRTGGSEEAAPVIRASHWRKAFLGIFLIVLGLTAVGYVVSFIYVVVSVIANIGLAPETDSKVWQSLVKDGFAIALFGLSALLYARDYRGVSEGNVLFWRKLHRYGLVLFAIVAAIVFAAVPLRQQRSAYADSLIVGDINTISSAISDFANSKQRLPEAISDLDIPKQVKTRSVSLAYEYNPSTTGGSYELCATFKTDASKNDGDSPLEALSAATSANSGTNQSASKHQKGHQCFTKTAPGLYSTTKTTPSSKLTPSSDDPTDPSYDNYDYDDTNSL